MNNKKVINGIIICLCFMIIFVIYIFLNKNNTENSTKSKTENNKDSILNELKEEYKITGMNDEIYEVETEKEGRKVIKVKPSINYQVAFCGMIKKEKPSFEELDKIYEKNSPKENGIWINENDAQTILSYLNSNENLKSKYAIDENGYLKISQINNQTEYDIKIQNAINKDKQYIISISSIYYMVDTVTGNIVDNPYNELDKYQTYDYCKDKNKIIIFISENKDESLSSEEIFMSILDLIEIE